MNNKNYSIYIMSGKSKVIYVGVTSDLARRIWEHKNKALANSFTARYNLSKLVYFEMTDDLSSARAREKQLKRYPRKWKVELIEKENPGWKDLSEEWEC